MGYFWCNSQYFTWPCFKIWHAGIKLHAIMQTNPSVCNSYAFLVLSGGGNANQRNVHSGLTHYYYFFYLFFLQILATSWSLFTYKLINYYRICWVQNSLCWSPLTLIWQRVVVNYVCLLFGAGQLQWDEKGHSSDWRDKLASGCNADSITTWGANKAKVLIPNHIHQKEHFVLEVVGSVSLTLDLAISLASQSVSNRCLLIYCLIRNNPLVLTPVGLNRGS